MSAAVTGREATGQQLKALALRLSRIALEAREPLTMVADLRLAEAVRATHKASQELFDVAIDVLRGHAPLAFDPGDREAQADPYPLLRSLETPAPPNGDGPPPDDPPAAADPPLDLCSLHPPKKADGHAPRKKAGKETSP